MAGVVLLGTLDTKGAEYAWLGERLRAAGCTVTVLDAGTFSDTPLADGDLGPERIARAAGADLGELRERGDRGAAVETMGRGAAVLLRELYDSGRVDGVLAVGGSGGSSIAGIALRALPVGVPKLLVSTMASGDVRPYVGDTDVTLMYSVVDIAGINSISRAVLGNAAAGIAAMAGAHAARRAEPGDAGAPVIAATMFGLTTPAVQEAREYLEAAGYEVLVFHATGTGGRAMESLAASGFLAGVLDLTTTELADELVGGVLSAGEHRLEAAGAHGVPQVVSVGALDMVNFGPRDSVPDRFAGRRLLVHNPAITLVRTTAEEMAALGARIAATLSGARGPAEVLLPLGGVSGIDVPGGPFHDPDADAACFTAVRAGLADGPVPVREMDAAINDPGFGRRAAETLHRLITSRES